MDVGSIAYFCTANIFAMGTIQRQTIAGTIYTYIGVGVGFVTTALLMPKMLLSEQVGLLKLLVAYSVLYSTFANLGTLNVAAKFFPYFRDESKGHNGFLFLLIATNLVGFVLFLIFFFLMKGWLLDSNAEKPVLLSEYILWVIPITFSLQFFNVFDIYFRVLYNAVKGTVARELLLRVALLGSILVFYWFDFVSFSGLVMLYSSGFIIPFVYLVWSAKRNGYLYFNFRSDILTIPLIKEMGLVGLFSIVSGVSGMIVLQIDSIMVNKFFGLSATGVYSVCFFFGTLIVMPSRVLKKIGATYIAEAWKNNDLDQIGIIYEKSTINQFLVGVFIFVGIWVNTRLIFHLLPEEYSQGLYVILFVSLANVAEMAGGVCASIIGLSKHYKYSLYMIMVFVLLVIVANYLLIPIFGLAGAALASFVSMFLFKVMQFLFLWKVFGFQPYSWKHLLLVLTTMLSIVVAQLLPEFENIWIDAFLTSMAVSLFFSVAVVFFNLSEDVKAILSKVKPV